jgi:hypothetical protein
MRELEIQHEINVVSKSCFAIEHSGNTSCHHVSTAEVVKWLYEKKKEIRFLHIGTIPEPSSALALR